MDVPVRDAKIYVDILGQIVIGYETKGTTMLLSVGEEKITSDEEIIDCICVKLITDEWFITQPRSPRALTKRRADIYISLEEVNDVIKMLKKIDRNHPGLRASDCPGFRPSFFPSGLEEGPKILPKGFNCFRAPLLDASLQIKELNTTLKPISGEFFIDYEESDRTHWYRFTTPALHFAMRAPRWSKTHEQIDQNEWTIYIDVKCEKAMIECIRRIASS